MNDNSGRTIEAVAKELQARGYRATFEDSFIEVLTDTLRLEFGIANEKWDGHIYPNDGDQFAFDQGTITTAVPATSQDITATADALAAAIESCRTKDEARRTTDEEG